MTIKMEFESYTEMYAFCADIVGSKEPKKEKPAAAQEPEEKQQEAAAPEEESEVQEAAASEEKESEVQEEEHVYSKTEVRAYLAKLQKEGKKKEVSALINGLGYSKFSEVPEDRYPELMKKAGDL